MQHHASYLWLLGFHRDRSWALICFLCMWTLSHSDVVRSNQIAAFVDDTKVFKEITSTRDVEQLQEDLSDLLTWSDSASLNFNYSKCKAQRIKRKLKSVSFVYHVAGSIVSVEKYLGVYNTDNLTCNKQVNEQCAKARRILVCCPVSGRYQYPDT